MKPNITEVIKTLTERYISEHRFSCAADINRGECENFAQDVVSQVYGGNVYGVEEFQTSAGGFDWGHLTKEWNIAPPEGFSATDIDALKLGGHLWVIQRIRSASYHTVTNRHYDCECPEGVDSFFELPFFKRQLARKD